MSARPIEVKKYVPTGCTILNLFLSGRVDGGWLQGTINHVVGDSDTGKTLLLLTTMAAVAHDSRFNKWKLKHDDVETANEFDIPNMFGKLEDRLESPYDDGSSSELLDGFYHNIIDLLHGKAPVLYGLDSMDALDTKTDQVKFDKQHEAAAEDDSDKKPKGSFGTAKAKMNSDCLKKLKNTLLPANGGILLIISQTRDAINTNFPHKVHAGGNALKFYANSQLWLAVEGPIKKQVHGIDRQIGTRVKVKIAKNHTTGKHGVFSIPMYYGHGIDDVLCSIDWMVAEGFWKMEKGVVTTRKEFLGKEKFQVESLRAQAGSETWNQVIQKAWDEVERSVRRPGRWSTETETAPVEAFDE